MAAMKKIRSGPVYVETERGTISLVFEADAFAGDAGQRPVIAGKPDVYIIDGEGVHKAKRSDHTIPRLMLGIAVTLALWAAYLVFQREGR